MNNFNLEIYLRKVDKDIIRNDIKTEQIQDFINPCGSDEIEDDEYEEIDVNCLEKRVN